MEASSFFIPDRAFLAQASIKLTVWPKMTSCSLSTVPGLQVYCHLLDCIFILELSWLQCVLRGAMLIAFFL